MRILLLEDEPKLAQAIKRALELQHYAVDISIDGEQAISLAMENLYDVMIFDIMVPRIDGLEACRQIRQAKISTPILMLTAKTLTNDKITGLDAGADDYMSKPFAFEELFARIRALIRRNSTLTDPILTLDNLTLNPTSMKVTRAGKTISLLQRIFHLGIFAPSQKHCRHSSKNC